MRKRPGKIETPRIGICLLHGEIVGISRGNAYVGFNLLVQVTGGFYFLDKGNKKGRYYRYIQVTVDHTPGSVFKVHVVRFPSKVRHLFLLPEATISDQETLKEFFEVKIYLT